MKDSFDNIIKDAQSVLIVLPKTPFFDQVAAGLSLYLLLKDQKQVRVVSSEPMTVEFNRLIGVNKVTQSMGDKNLVISLSGGYNPQDVEKVDADIVDGKFELVVMPKEGRVPPKKEQVEIGYGGSSADTVILIGGLRPEHFSPFYGSNDLKSAKFVHIGIKDLQGVDGKVLSLAQPSSSVSELVATLILEVPIDADIATNLVMGIEAGSDGFSPDKTNSNTFLIFAKLLEKGAKRLGVQHELPKQYPPGSIPGETPVRVIDDIQGQKVDAPPKDWYQKPKIYKGTSVE